MAQINLGGSIGTTGVSILGNANVSITNANYTLLATEYSNYFISVTSSVSLTAQRNIVAPLTAGLSFIVKNSTSGGQQIQIIGPSGTGVIIPQNETILVISDGINYYTPGITLQGRPISNNTPTDQQVLTWVAANNDWEPQNIDSVTFVNTDYTVNSSDKILLVNFTATHTIILPSTGTYIGRKIIIKDISGNAETFAIILQPSPGGSGTFDGLSGNFTYNAPYGSITLILGSTGPGSAGNWYII